MTDEEIKQLEDYKDKLYNLFEKDKERASRIRDLCYANLIRKPYRFIFSLRCPDCNKKLTLKLRFWDYVNYDDPIGYRHYICSCGYEYVK